MSFIPREDGFSFLRAHGVWDRALAFFLPESVGGTVGLKGAAGSRTRCCCFCLTTLSGCLMRSFTVCVCVFA